MEKLEFAITPTPAETAGDAADPIFELAASMRADAGSAAFRAEAKAFIQRMVADLPADSRDFAGKDESGTGTLPRRGAFQRHRPSDGAPKGR